MLKISINTSLFLLLLVNIVQPVSAQTCIKGDCKNGFGVLRIGNGSSFSYQIGNFNKKGKLEGKSVLMSWSNANLSNEADFLFALSQNIPPVEKLWEFKPSFIKSGNFVNGQLEGPGIMLMNQVNYFPSIAWIPEKWFKNATLRFIKYEGNFINSSEQKAGVVTFMYPNDTLICASDDLYQNNLYQSNEMVIDIRRKDASSNQLIRANFVNKKMHGWAVKNENKSGIKENLFFRQLWCYGKLIHEDSGGAYPFDMVDPQTIKDDKGREITGPMRNGKVNGFGTIRYGLYNQYQGYIKDNRPDGFGYMDTIGATKYGMFSNGFFEQGTWMSYWNIRFIVEEGRKDNFKEGYITRKTYSSIENYLAGHKPFESSEGYMIQATGWHGNCVFYDQNKMESRYYENGKLISSNTQDMVAAVNTVLTKDGVASFVKSSSLDGSFQTADGRFGNIRKNEWTKSSHTKKEFYGFCPNCNGSGIVVESGSVAGSTSTSTRTEQYTQGAVVGYWQGTRKVTTSTYTPGYNFKTSYRCTNQNYEYIYLQKGSFDTETWHAKIIITSIRE